MGDNRLIFIGDMCTTTEGEGTTGLVICLLDGKAEPEGGHVIGVGSHDGTWNAFAEVYFEVGHEANHPHGGLEN